MRAALLGIIGAAWVCSAGDSVSAPSFDAASDVESDGTVGDSSVDAASDSGGASDGSDARDATDTGGSVDSSKDSSGDAPSDASKEASSDGGGGSCIVDADCRKFSSYCNGTKLKICTCYALKATDADPKCDGTTGTCFVDPCATKTARCVSGTCQIVSP